MGYHSQGQESLYTGKEVGFADIVYLEDLTKDDFLAGKAKGKIVLAFQIQSSLDIEEYAKSNGVVGVIIASKPYDHIAPGTTDIPYVYVDFEIGMDIMLYFKTTK